MITVGETFSSDEFVVTLDDDGTPGEAAVTVTITLPDGVTTVNPSPANPSFSVYRFDYLTTVAGRHEYVVTATGGDLGDTVVKLGEDVFHVDDRTTAAALVGLAETKKFLGITASRTVHDDELRRFIVSASESVEAETHLWHRATVVERLAPATSLFLDKRPVVSITSVQQGATTFDAAGYRLSTVGALQAAAGYYWPPWLCSTVPDDVVVTYEAGETVVPMAVREAVLLTVADAWETQRGPTAMPLQDSGDVDTDLPPPTGSLPAAAMVKLQPWLKGPVLA